MGLLNPLSLLFGLSIAALVLIYLRARSRSTLDVSSLLLFEEIQASVSKVRFLKLDLLFWLELLTLAALSLAIAGLYLKMAPIPVHHRSHALVFDLAAGMGAREGSRTRLDKAKSEALSLVGSAAPGERFAVVGFAGHAEVERYFTADLASVRAAIDALKPRDIAAAPAALAAALMRVRDADEIELFASRLPAGATVDKADSARLHYHRIGQSDDNAAITALDPGVPRATPGHCTVRNMSAKTVLADTRISLNGHYLGRAGLILPPHAQGTFGFGPLPGAGIVKAQIKTPDALLADNTRYAYAPGSRTLKGVVVSPDASVRDDLARVLRAVDPSSIVVAGAPGSLNSTQIDKSFGGKEPDIAIIHDADGAGIKAAAKLFIFPRGARKFDVKSTLPVSQMDDRTDLGPLTRPLVLGATRDISLPAWMDPIADGNAPGHAGVLPLAAFGVTAHGRQAVIAFDIRGHRLMDPDMLDTLVLTIDLIKDLTAPRDIHVVSTGTYLTIPATHPAKITEPDGSTTEITPSDAQVIRFRPVYAGAYQITIGKRHETVYANYFDAAESDLSVKPAAAAQTSISRVINLEPSVPARRIQPLGLALIALALLAFLVESALLLKRAARGGPTVV